MRLVFYLPLLCIFFGSSAFATTIRSVVCGKWTDPKIWDLNRIPVSTDTIVVSNFVQFDTDFTSERPGFLQVTRPGNLCGLHTYSGHCWFGGIVFIKSIILYYGNSLGDTNINVLVVMKIQGTASLRLKPPNINVCVGCKATCDSCKATPILAPGKEEEREAERIKLEKQELEDQEKENETTSCLMTFPNLLLSNGVEENRNLVPACVSKLKSYQLNVFNRWGKLVFSSSWNGPNWNGRSNSGEVLAEGVYYYEFKYEFLKPNAGLISKSLSAWVKLSHQM